MDLLIGFIVAVFLGSIVSYNRISREESKSYERTVSDVKFNRDLNKKV